MSGKWQAFHDRGSSSPQNTLTTRKEEPECCLLRVFRVFCVFRVFRGSCRHYLELSALGEEQLTVLAHVVQCLRGNR